MLNRLRKKSLVCSYFSKHLALSLDSGYATLDERLSTIQKKKLVNLTKHTSLKCYEYYGSSKLLRIDASFKGAENTMLLCTVDGSKLHKNFYLGEAKVTQELYLKLMETNPSFFNASNTEGLKDQKDLKDPYSLKRAVEQVSWHDAVNFCNKLSHLHGLDPVYSTKSYISICIYRRDLLDTSKKGKLAYERFYENVKGILISKIRPFAHKNGIVFEVFFDDFSKAHDIVITHGEGHHRYLEVFKNGRSSLNLSEKLTIARPFTVNVSTEVALKNLIESASNDFWYMWDESKNGYRLPLQSEWEYAAKAGTNDTFSGSNDHIVMSRDYAVVYTEWPEPVKSKKPNGWGYYDMTSITQEWCWDKYGNAENVGSSRLTKSGSSGPKVIVGAISHTDSHLPSTKNNYLGFRLARTATINNVN